MKIRHIKLLSLAIIGSATLASAAAVAMDMDKEDTVSMTQGTKKQLSTDHLTPLQKKVTLKGGTEPPFKNEYWDNHQEGIYVDVIDGTPLYSSIDKFESGTGWPSFTKPISTQAVKEQADNSLFMKRTEIRSASSDSHLGHVFPDGPVEAGGKRYCMNSAALRFVPKEALKKEGYGEYLKLFDK